MLFILADVARAHPRRVVWLQETSAARAQLELLNGYDADPRGGANRLTNRMRALLATYWPALERALDDRLDTIGGTALLKRYPSAPQLRQAGAKRLVTLLRATHRVHQPEAWVEQLLVAAKSQTVVVAGAETAAGLIAELAEQLLRVLTRRQSLEKEIERAFFGLPEASILRSLPGIGPRLGARILIEIGDIRQFRTFASFARPPNWLPMPDWAPLRTNPVLPFAATEPHGSATTVSRTLNGVPATASSFLQTTLLRQRLGFGGVIISDYKDVQAIWSAYHVAPDLAGAIAAAVNAGLDMAMWADAPDQWQSNILADVAEGKISESRIDESVRRILTLKFELGLFDQPCENDASTPCVDADGAATAVQAGRDATLQAARESITLLKNTNNVLPIDTSANVSVTGPNADSMVGQLGGWSVSWQGVSTSGHGCCEGPPGQIPPGTTVLQGIRSVDPAVTFAASQDQAVAAAGGADVIVAVVGEQTYAEGVDDDPAPSLPAAQKDLLTALEATGKPVIVVVLAGRPLGLGAITEQHARAILMAYQGGTETGQAVADVLFGIMNPSGKLPVSWPTDAETRAPFGSGGDFNGRASLPLGDQPKVFDQLPSTSSGTATAYNALFSFGFGLSYTTFSVGSLGVPAPAGVDGSASAVFTVTNTGGKAGVDVVPVFVHQETSQVVVPPHCLVGFARVELMPGESRTVNIEFPLSRLAMTPGDIETTAPPRVEPGVYVVEVPTQPEPNDLFPSSSPPLQAEFRVS